ncbi:MAG: YdeI/OmpD-associated family protein [Pseudomonadota bacterium]
MTTTTQKPRFFRDGPALRRWFAAHHADTPALLLGYWKVDSGKPSVSWPESVDEALCVGWIDGVRKRIDEASYTIRFTPRKATSIWSAVNIVRVQALETEGRMQDAGRVAYAARRENRSGVYSFEQRSVELPETYAAQLRAAPAAWADFQRRPPSYRKAAMWWIVSAKQEATRLRRLQVLIDCSARGKPIPPFDYP